jgi:hypothetical protein
MGQEDNPTDELKRRLRNLQLGIRSTTDAPTVVLSGEGVIGADRIGEPGHTLAQWMAHRYNRNFNEYDRAIDHAYNTTHIGGSHYHHIIDGHHSIWGAFHAVQHVQVDDSWLTQMGHALNHLAHDATSISGINPFFSLTPDHFDALAGMVGHLGISKPFLADALTVNGPELIGGSVALISALLMAKKAPPERLSRFGGGCLLSAAWSANPLLLPIAAASMAYAIHHAEGTKTILIQAGKGGFVSGSAILVSSVLAGHGLLTCLAALMTGVAVSKAIDNPAAAFERARHLVEAGGHVLREAALGLRALRADQI